LSQQLPNLEAIKVDAYCHNPIAGQMNLRLNGGFFNHDIRVCRCTLLHTVWRAQNVLEAVYSRES
jgi:hypothetical protein